MRRGLSYTLLGMLIGALCSSLWSATSTNGVVRLVYAKAPTDHSSKASPLRSAFDWSVTIEGEGICGGGSIVDPRGLVVTSLHVVEGISSLTVTLSDGRVLPARILDRDKRLDLALLALDGLEGEPLPAASLGSTLSLRPGEELYMIGCPSGLPQTLSRGIVGYVGRTFRGVRYIQSDMPIQPGNSGGPLLNAQGELVGVVSLKLKEGTRIGFSLPIEYALDRFRQKLALGSMAGLHEFRTWSRKSDAPATPREQDYQFSDTEITGVNRGGEKAEERRQWGKKSFRINNR